jgi:chromosome segregation ATPase
MNPLLTIIEGDVFRVMADVTFGVKVAPELKEKIEQLIKESDFNTHKEWFQHLLSVYDLHQLKHLDGTKRYASDLEFIEQYLTRIQETIVQMMKKAADAASDQETLRVKETDHLKQQLQHNEELRKELAQQLADAEEQASQDKKNLLDEQKQRGVLDDLCTTLKKSIQDKEAENEILKQKLEKHEQLEATIQRVMEENQNLKQQTQMQQHQIDLIHTEYKSKLEIERLRTEYAQRGSEQLLQSRNLLVDTDGASSQRKRGRPRKDQPALPGNSKDNIAADIDEIDDDQHDLPQNAEDYQELLGDDPPQSPKE